MYGKRVKGIARTSFLIGPDGKVAHVFENVTPEGDAEQVLTVLRRLERSNAGSQASPHDP